MVVDDDPDILGVLSDFLSDEGHKVITINNGIEALAKFQESDIDLVLLDMSMPVMNGMEVLKKIHEKKPGTVAIMVTAFQSQEIVNDTSKTGIFEYVYKPFDLKDLRNAVNRALKKAEEGI